MGADETDVKDIINGFVLQRTRNWIINHNDKTASTSSYLIPSTDVRIARLRSLASFVQDNEYLLLDALRHDLGRDPSESTLVELAPLRSSLSYYIENIDRLTTPSKTSHIPLPFILDSSFIDRVPHGTCVIFSTWNFPILLSLGPLTAALAGGNTIVLKLHPSSLHVNKVISDNINKYLDSSVVQIVTGDIVQNKALMALPFNHFFVTGSSFFGRIVYKSAANHLSPCVLELGGKSPVIIDAVTADPKITANRLIWAKSTNAGQVCLSPDYVIILNNDKYLLKNKGKSYKDILIIEIKNALSEFYGDTWTNAPIDKDGNLSREINDYKDPLNNPVGNKIATNAAESRIPNRYRSKFSRIINIAQYKRTLKIISTQFENKNVKIEVPGIITNEETRLITPFIFSGYPLIEESNLSLEVHQQQLFKHYEGLVSTAISNDDSNRKTNRKQEQHDYVSDEELFCPVIPIYEATSKEAAAEYITDIKRNNPLVLYLFSKDKNLQSYFRSSVDAGTFMVNDLLTNMAIEDLPFGGVATSGLGCYHGEFGFHTYTRPKANKISPLGLDFILEPRYPNRLLSDSSSVAKACLKVLRKFTDSSPLTANRYAGGGGGFWGFLIRLTKKRNLVIAIAIVSAYAYRYLGK